MHNTTNKKSCSTCTYAECRRIANTVYYECSKTTTSKTIGLKMIQTHLSVPGDVAIIVSCSRWKEEVRKYEADRKDL